MSSESWIALAALATVIVGGTLGAFIGWLTAMWWKLARIETNQAVANSLMASHLEHDAERFEDHKERLDRHSVRLDDAETALIEIGHKVATGEKGWRPRAENPRSSWHKRKPLKDVPMNEGAESLGEDSDDDSSPDLKG